MSRKKSIHVRLGKIRAAADASGESRQTGEAARQARISEAAYYRAQQRGFEPGRELEDWLSAEAEVTGMSLLRDLQPETH